MVNNYFAQQRNERIYALIEALKAAKIKGTTVGLTQLYNVYWEDYGVSTSLLKKYFNELEQRGIAKVDYKSNTIEYIGEL